MTNEFRSNRLSPILLILLVGSAGAFAPVNAQETTDHCIFAERFLVEDRGMVALTEPATIQDWRTRQQLAGCHVTAAGITTISIDDEATRFYERVQAAGWTRTPNPVDAPGEASLRFRMEDSDCLFNFYSAGHLGTPADLEVSMEVVPGDGEERYNIFVMCKPAMEAAPRPAPDTTGRF